jgi:hypothetical protein
LGWGWAGGGGRGRDLKGVQYKLVQLNFMYLL